MNAATLEAARKGTMPEGGWPTIYGAPTDEELAAAAAKAEEERLAELERLRAIPRTLYGAPLSNRKSSLCVVM